MPFFLAAVLLLAVSAAALDCPTPHVRYTMTIPFQQVSFDLSIAAKSFSFEGKLLATDRAPTAKDGTLSASFWCSKPDHFCSLKLRFHKHTAVSARPSEELVKWHVAEKKDIVVNACVDSHTYKRFRQSHLTKMEVDPTAYDQHVAEQEAAKPKPPPVRMPVACGPDMEKCPLGEECKIEAGKQTGVCGRLPFTFCKRPNDPICPPGYTCKAPADDFELRGLCAVDYEARAKDAAARAEAKKRRQEEAASASASGAEVVGSPRLSLSLSRSPSPLPISVPRVDGPAEMPVLPSASTSSVGAGDPPFDPVPCAGPEKLRCPASMTCYAGSLTELGRCVPARCGRFTECPRGFVCDFSLADERIPDIGECVPSPAAVATPPLVRAARKSKSGRVMDIASQFERQPEVRAVAGAAARSPSPPAKVSPIRPAVSPRPANAAVPCGGPQNVRCMGDFKCFGSTPEKEGKCVPTFCGGFAGRVCPAGFSCEMDDARFGAEKGECVPLS